MLDRALRQRCEPISRARNSFRGFLRNRNSNLPGLIEHDRVTVNDLERGNRRITLHTSHCLLPDPLHIGVRVESAAIGTARSSIRISQEVAFYPTVVTRCRRE